MASSGFARFFDHVRLDVPVLFSSFAYFYHTKKAAASSHVGPLGN